MTCGKVVIGHSVKGSSVRVTLSPHSSPVQLRPSGVWIACDSCTQKNFEITQRVRESPQSRSQASNSGWSRNHWASMAPNCSESRGISPVPGFQFWLKSESLGLDGTQLQWEKGNLPGPRLPILAEVGITGPRCHPTAVIELCWTNMRAKTCKNIYHWRNSRPSWISTL
jgi:hypothetical protein